MTIVALVRRLLRGPVKASVAICRHCTEGVFQYHYKRHRDRSHRDGFICNFVRYTFLSIDMMTKMIC